MVVPPEIDAARIDGGDGEPYGVDELAGILVTVDGWYTTRGDREDAEGWARILLGVDEPAAPMD